LTERGENCYALHQNFHEEMVNAVVGGFKSEDLPLIVDVLTKLKMFFEKRLEKISSI